MSERLINIGLVACGGAAGSVSRYLVGIAIKRYGFAGFPWATWTVNLSGAFLLGYLMGLTMKHDPNFNSLYILLGVGFLGAFTTFSTLSMDSVLLLREQRTVLFFANTFLQISLGVALAYAGFKVAS